MCVLYPDRRVLTILVALRPAQQRHGTPRRANGARFLLRPNSTRARSARLSSASALFACTRALAPDHLGRGGRADSAVCGDALRPLCTSRTSDKEKVFEGAE